MTDFVGRSTDSNRLAEWANVHAWATEPRRLHVCAVCGPGGVGKTCLVHHALDAMVLSAGEFLVLRIGGGDHPTSRDLFTWVEWLVGSAAELRARAPNAFSRTRCLVEYQKELSQRLAEDLRERKMDDATIDAARVLFGIGRISEKVFKKNFAGLLKKESLEDLKVIFDVAASGPARTLARNALDLPRRKFRRYRGNRFADLASALVADLEELLSKKRRATKEFSRLLLIIDDYEFLEQTIGVFLTQELLPRLRGSTGAADLDFQSLVIILGRDELTNTSEAIWQQTPLREDLSARQVVLSPLSAEEVRSLCELRGRDGKNWESVFSESQGYPWLAELIIDEMTPDGTVPATVYTNFLKRMSRFMTDTQRNWFKRICFLDRVNLEGIESVVDLSATPGLCSEDVLDWFRSEPSIRDTKAGYHAVWPFIRQRVLMSQWLDSPREFATFAERAGFVYNTERGPELTRTPRAV